MADFQTALNVTLANEGGLQSIPADRGNLGGSSTNRGVTLATLAVWRKMRSRPAPTNQDVLALTLGETAEIYRALYWQPLSGDAQRTQPLATIVFDAGVLCGVGTSAKMLQQVIAACGQPVLADGVLGPRSMAALDQIAPSRVASMLIDKHSDRFADIVLADATQAQFLPIWRRRRSGWTALLCP